LLVDGSIAGVASVAPFTFVWNTAAVPSGTHTLHTRVFDTAGNSALSAPVAVNVTSPVAFGVVITSPNSGANVARNTNLTISASGTGSAAVSRFEFYVNNSLVATDTSAPYTGSWKVPAKRGIYSIQVKGFSITGTFASQTINVNVQ
jgi:hypothetical protein